MNTFLSSYSIIRKLRLVRKQLPAMFSLLVAFPDPGSSSNIQLPDEKGKAEKGELQR